MMHVRSAGRPGPAQRRRRAAPARLRGAAAVAMILVLVTSQLLIVGAVIAGARDQDVNTLRLDSIRSFYAAEAGMNMAVREIMKGIDEDGDGTVGTISNNNNANDDPLMIKARVLVTKTMSGTDTLASSSARCGSTRRKVTALVKGANGSASQTVVTAWGHASSGTPKYCTWTGAAWSAAMNMPSVSGEPKWIRLKLCPVRNETTFICEDLNKHVEVCFYNGSSWGSVSLLSSDTGGTNDRPEDIAYEQVTGDALCVYWKGTSSVFGYRTYNGTIFSAEQTIADPFSTEDDFLTLCPRPGSDEILLLAADGNAGGPLTTNWYNGSSFGSWTQLVASLETNNEECYAAAFEAQSRTALVVYTESGQSAPRYRTWNGTTWSAQSNMPTVGGVGHWVRLASDPTSDNILMVALDDQNDINANFWNGSAWGTNTELETNCADYLGRHFDVVFERGTGHALLVYGESGINTPRYRTWNGTTWSAEMSGPNIGSPTEIVWLARGLNNGEVFVAVSDSNSDLHLMRWDGTTLSGDNVVEHSLSGWVQYYSFATPEPTPAPHPRVLTWAEVAP